MSPAPVLEADPTLRLPAANGRGTGGGLAARRAVVRWAWRLFRREWRQQVLVVALLTLAVAAAVGGSAAVHGTIQTDDGDLGSASRRLDLVVAAETTRTGATRSPGANASPGTGGSAGGKSVAPRPAHGAADLVERAEAAFDRVDAIGRSFVPIPGSVATLELRAQTPGGPFGAPMLALLAGRYPTSAGEIAVTDGAAASLGVGMGDEVDLDGVARTVVGRIENPADLGDEFALVPPSEIDQATSLSLLVDADDTRIDAFLQTLAGGFGSRARGDGDATTAAALTLAMSTVVLLLVSLIAAAGFVVIAQRRLRQLGMLAAVGATERHLRLVLLVDGAVVGVVAALAGTALGIGGWIVAAPRLENAAGHRIDPNDVPLWLVVAGMVLAVATAVAAAWWPARVIARVPITQALSARPPRPHPVHRSVLVAVVLMVVGFVCLSWAFDPQSTVEGVPVVVGVVSLALGVLLTSPTVVRVLPAIAGRLPVAVRLALRDLGRNQARSGAALAAISLALGIAVSVVVIASAVEYQSDRNDGPGNVADDQLLLHVSNPPPLVPERTAAQLDQMQDAVDRLAASLGGSTVVPIDAVVDPRGGVDIGFDDTTGGRASDILGEPLDEDSFMGHVVDVATPELLELAGVDPEAVDPDADVLSVVEGDLVWIFRRSDDPGDRPIVQHIDGPAYTALPSSLMTPAAIERQGLETVRSGWLVESSSALTDAQLERAREAAAAAGLFLEARREPASSATLRTAATAIGLLLALGILAMTVGLLRSEAAGDLRTLTATGASSRVRRAITAATAAALAFLGALLGTAGAYAALVAGYLHDLAPLGHVPVVDLVVVLVGLPLAAALAGWLLAGREPPTLTRQPT